MILQYFHRSSRTQSGNWKLSCNFSGNTSPRYICDSTPSDLLNNVTTWVFLSLNHFLKVFALITEYNFDHTGSVTRYLTHTHIGTSILNNTTQLLCLFSPGSLLFVLGGLMVLQKMQRSLEY